jgi:hypothetical protein
MGRMGCDRYVSRMSDTTDDEEHLKLDDQCPRLRQVALVILHPEE